MIFSMRKTNFWALTSVLPIVGITALPATAAAPFTSDSTLGWTDGTSDFNAEASAIIDGFSTELLEIIFSPTALGGLASYFVASGDFAEFFGPPDFVSILPLDSAAGTFDYLGLEVFELEADLTFSFDLDGDETTINDRATATMPGGSKFSGFKQEDGSVEFNLISGEWGFSLPNGKMATASNSFFQFSDTVGGGGGLYTAQGEVSVPEPASLLGLAAIGAVVAGSTLKKRTLV
jgi:hypothetical protein